MRRLLVACVLGGALIVSPALVRAQIVAPPIEQRALELGYAYKWFDRDVDSGTTDAIEWEAASLYLRMGAWHRVTFVAEGGLWDVEAADPERTYARWVVGAGATVRAFTRKRWSLDAQLAYNEIFDHDDSELRTDHRTYGWNAGVMLNGAFRPGGQRLDVFAGPMYVVDVAEVYPYSSDDPVRTEPPQNWGVCAGLYGVVFDHVSGFAHVLYVDEPQLRLGISVRSRGESP